jgi:tRNA(Phe) wybutosine-synthesizing methylase Tyw3
MKAAEKNGHTTAAMQTREALADPEYIKLIEARNIANEQALSLKWKLKLFEMRFEWARTKAANRRAEMNLR